MLLALGCLAGPLSAQGEASLTESADLHRDPSGTPLVTLPSGAPVEPGEGRGEWREVTVEGWIYTPSTAPTRRDGFDLVVSEDKGENLRQSPNGPVVGRARKGVLLERVGERGKWSRVRRAGWVPKEAVAAEPGPSQGSAPPAAPRAPPPPANAASRSALGMQTARETGLVATPDGPSYGTLQAGTPARVVGRAEGWARVQVEGWVREDDLSTPEGGALVGVTAAEVRSDPQRFVGQTLDWRLQVIAVQTADELRAELPPGQPYLLTRGPLPEPGFVYVALPADRVDAFRALPPLQEVVLRVTIRAARTRYLTTPVAELASVVSGMEGK